MLLQVNDIPVGECKGFRLENIELASGVDKKLWRFQMEDGTERVLNADRIKQWNANDTADGQKIYLFSYGDKVDNPDTIGFGCFGNGTTAWTRAIERNADYLNVAHIGDDGSLTWFYDAVAGAARKKIVEFAESRKQQYRKEMPYG